MGKSQSTLSHYGRCLTYMALHFKCSPLELDKEPLISRKLVCREVCSEGSGTTNSGTDGQKMDMRLNKPDGQTHHCNVQKPEMGCVY